MQALSVWFFGSVQSFFMGLPFVARAFFVVRPRRMLKGVTL